MHIREEVKGPMCPEMMINLSKEQKLNYYRAASITYIKFYTQMNLILHIYALFH